MSLFGELRKQFANLERRSVPRNIRAADLVPRNFGPVASAKPLMNPYLASVVGAGGMASNLLGRAGSLYEIVDTAKNVFNPKDNIITSLQNLGTSVENQFSAPGQERRYVGSNPLAVAANRRLDARKPLNSIQTGKYGPTDWNPSANPQLTIPSAPELPPSVGGAAERNYEAEKRRAAQLAMQDQLSKKYQVADLTKAYNTASPEEKEKIGLQIWATTNPELAQKLRPGQTGYSEAVSAFQSQGPMGAITKAVGDMEYANRAFGAAPTTPVPAFGALQAPISGINLPPADQLGVKENLFASAPPGVPSTVFTDPLKSFSPEALSQTQLALLRQAFNKKLK
jgi:hypothetical protein